MNEARRVVKEEGRLEGQFLLRAGLEEVCQLSKFRMAGLRWTVIRCRVL